MSRLELGRIGVTVEPEGGDTSLRDAAALEELGYATIWLPGGRLPSLEPVRQAIRATTRVPVGTAILAVERFDAATVAGTYAELGATNPGRFLVGLGGAHGPRPLPVLNAYLDELDAADPPVPRSARVLAALGPRKLELARERCAGAIPLLVTPEYTAWARGILGPEPTLVIQQYVVLDRDPATAREAARVPMRFLTTVAGYRSNLRRMGFTETQIADLDDRLVDAVTAWGDADDIAARVNAHLDAGADQVAIVILPREQEQVPGRTEQPWRHLAQRLIR